ncbi:MAG: alpha/beta hydrolase [Muribaculaceae bacterium]|nr:alpha/beta hydrolase [Muribaculaceae bacterium]
MRKLIKAQTRRGVQLDGVIFAKGGENTVVIAITGIHGNFYSNPMYYNIGDTLCEHGIAFIYAQTNDAFNKMETVNTRTGNNEIIGSFNECFDDICDDINAYVKFAEAKGYGNIILAGHSLGANKVIHYLANAQDTSVKHYILVSPANMKYMLSNVTDDERDIIRYYVDNGMEDRMLPFPFMGWAPMIAKTAWQWLWRNPLDNVHSDSDGDFSEVERIRQTGALIIGTYDRFSYGEPRAFIELINSHTQQPDMNEVIFVEGTGHVYTEREQMLADIILRLAERWSI